MKLKSKNPISSCSIGLKNIVRNLLVVVLLLTAMASACPKPETKKNVDAGPARVALKTGETQETTVEVELARTEEQRSKGLMYRKELGANQGMLFIMPYAENQKFWMKNTLIPLDMIFIGDDLRVVGIAENAQPEDTSIYEVGKAARYVLEVNGGFSARNNIREGNRVRFLGFEVE
jgi:uncharacterized protein